MKINFKGWQTAPSGTHICRSCRYATIVKGHRESEEILSCSQLERTPQFMVTECSSYSNKALPTLGEMKEKAWVLEQTKGGKIGFISSIQMSKRNPNWKWEDDD